MKLLFRPSLPAVSPSRFSNDRLSKGRFRSARQRWPGMLVILVCFVLGMTGCKKDTNVADSQTSPEEVTPAIEKVQTTSVPASKNDIAASPAAAGSKHPTVDAPPSEICTRFVNFLKAGKRVQAENLLTRAALSTTLAAGLQLEPLGSPEARYRIGKTRYATIESKTAYVECEIIDSEDGTEFTSQITWMLRKQKQGWRIGGLMVELAPDQAPDLLSFENRNDVAKIKAMAAGDDFDTPEPRHADASTVKKERLQ